MKKSLVALAAMSVIGAVSAQSSVTLYGLADAYIGSERLGIKASGATAGTNGVTQTVVNSCALAKTWVAAWLLSLNSNLVSILTLVRKLTTSAEPKLCLVAKHLWV